MRNVERGSDELLRFSFLKPATWAYVADCTILLPAAWALAADPGKLRPLCHNEQAPQSKGGAGGAGSFAALPLLGAVVATPTPPAVKPGHSWVRDTGNRHAKQQPDRIL